MAATDKLTDTAIRKAKPGPEPYKLRDGGGLYLIVRPDGAKWWRLDYRRPVTAKRNTLSFGTYADTGLAEARAKRDAARKLLKDGTDPGEQRKAESAAKAENAANTFGAIADEWLAKQRARMADVTYRKAEWMLGKVADLRPVPMHELTAPVVLEALRAIEGEGTIETAHRVKQRIGQVARYAIATGRAERDPTGDLRGALAPVVSTSRAAIIDPAGIANLLRDLHAYGGQPTTAAALKLAPLLMVRPGELRAMEWAELDLAEPNPDKPEDDKAEWRIPAGKMKMREGHIVPLPSQAVAILRALQGLTGHVRYCFPSLRTADRPMSENTVNAALRRMGYDKGTMTGHGFRAMASTRLNELGWKPDVIERQLAHAERNKVRAAYNRAQYLAERRVMLQAWADYLDGLRTNANVVPLHRKAS